jgi:hypothetical protein
MSIPSLPRITERVIKHKHERMLQTGELPLLTVVLSFKCYQECRADSAALASEGPQDLGCCLGYDYSTNGAFSTIDGSPIFVDGMAKVPVRIVER